MAARDVINPHWTQVRAHGIEATVVPFPPHQASLEPHQRQLLEKAFPKYREHHCPACGGSLGAHDSLVAVSLGPGVDPEARTAQRRGEWFDAAAVVCHAGCVGVLRPASHAAAMKVASASAMICEAAAQVSERVAALGVVDDFDPSPELLKIVDAVDNIAHQLSGWEEQLI